MPRINRFRIVNFKYDDDKKYIANELFDFDGENTLLNLENGGGKTIILQLALQVLMPNTQLGSRRFADYFKLDTGTVHIMTEWILDGTTTEYLLTGACFAKGTESIRYFTYTHSYSAFNKYDIKNIPVVDEKKQVADFHSFSRLLRDLASSTGHRINIYSQDRIKDYKQKLHTFNLFQEEFEAIKLINQSEGGVEKFFESARKSRHVVEKIIIPNMPHAEGDDEGILAKTFKQHSENLKNIPIFQHRIIIYDKFCEKANELLLVVNDYKQKVEENFICYKNLCILENLLIVLIKRLEDDMARIQEKTSNTNFQIEETIFKRESLKYRKELKKIQLLSQDLDKLNLELDNRFVESKQFEDKIGYQKSANDYLDYIEYNKELVKNQTMLENISKEQGELEEEYQNYLLYLKGLLEQKEENLAENFNDLKSRRGMSELEVEELQKTLVDINKERDIVKADIAVFSSDILKIEAEIKKISQFFWAIDTAIVFEPEQELTKMETAESDFLKEKQQALEEQQRLSNDIENNKIKESNIRLSLATAEGKKNNVQQHIKQYNEKSSSLMQQASVYEVEGSLYQDGFTEKLKVRKNITSGSLIKELNRSHDIQKKKLILDKSDYYIPDYEIKKVYEYLSDNNINCIPGSLWLKNQPEDKRQELLRLNPLMQYSIVVEQTEIKRIETLSEKIQELVEEYPVALVVNNSGGIRMHDQDDVSLNKEKEIDRIGLMDIYIIRAANTKLSTDENAFHEYIEKLDANLEETNLKISQYRQDENKIIRLINGIEMFITDYPEIAIKALYKDLEQLEAEINLHNNNIQQLKIQNEKIIKKLEDVSSNIELIDEKIKTNKEYMENLSKLIDANRVSRQYKLELGELIKQEDIIRNTRTKTEKDIEQLKNTLLELKSKIDYNRGNYEKNHKKLMGIESELVIKELSMAIPATTLEQAEGKIEGLKRKITNDQKDSIKDFITTLRNRMDERINSIHKNGYQEMDFQDISNRFHHEEIEANEGNLKNIKIQIDKLGIENSKLNKDINLLTGSTNNMEGQIKESFNKPPFIFDDISIVDIEAYEKLIRDYKKSLSRDMKNLEDLEIKTKDIKATLYKLAGIIEESKKGQDARQRIDFREENKLEDGTSIWEISKMKVNEIATLKNSVLKKYSESDITLNAAEKNVTEAYDKLYRDREWEDNEAVNRILKNIMRENIFNYEYLTDMFENIFLTVKNMKDATQLQLEECLKNKNEMVERSYRRAQIVYDELKQVDSFSKIRIGDVNIKTVIIQVPTLQAEIGKVLISQYLDKCIAEIGEMRENKTYDPGKIDEEIGKMMSPVRLFDAVIDLNEIVIKVYKPESNIELSRHIPWETVISWSGGEKLAGFFAMFISIISYLRYKKTNWHGSSKVIWIDNPFGQANAGHLLSYIFDLSKATKTQMICLTGLREVNIYAQFDVVYSLLHRMLMSNTSVIRSNLIKSNPGVETAFYKVEHEQMSFIE